MESLLVYPQTKEVSLIAPIHSPKRKVSPGRAKILIGGLIGGLFFGLLMMLGKRYFMAYKVFNGSVA
jgi:LPS O-antigen subunit length determinant protein (WzzB/FepE family)